MTLSDSFGVILSGLDSFASPSVPMATPKISPNDIELKSESSSISPSMGPFRLEPSGSPALVSKWDLRSEVVAGELRVDCRSG